MPSNDLVQSLTRGLTILEAVAEAEDGLSVGQLAAALDLKRPTAHNLARTLAARGYLVADGDPSRFRLGPALRALVGRHDQRALLQRVEQAIRQGQAATPDASWVYAEATGPEFRVVMRSSGRIERPTHDVLHPYDSATALCFLAFAGDSQTAVHAERYPFTSYHGEVWESAHQLEAFIATARRRGYAQPPAPRHGGFRISVPVFNESDGTLQGMLGLHRPSPADRTARRGLVAQLLNQASFIGERADQEKHA